MGRPPKVAPLTMSGAAKYEARIRELVDENVALQKQIDRQHERYQKLVDRTVELLFGDLKND